MGNKLGWILAGVFGLVIAGVLVKSLVFPSTPLTEPTRATLGEGMLTLQNPLKPLTTLLPAEPDGEGNAADDYRRAWKSYDKNNEAIKAMFKHYFDVMEDKYRLTDDDLTLLNSVAKPIADGAAKREMAYYSPENMEIPYWPVEKDQFQSLAEVPQMLFAHYLGKGEEGYPQAEKCAFDILVMAHHMIQERARVDIVRAGIGLQKHACALLGQLYGKWDRPERAEAAADYLDGLLDISSIYSDLYGLIWRLKQYDNGVIEGPNPGDIFNLVANHADRAIRVEAILGMGVVKLTCRSKGDQKRARDLINEKLNSDDPIEKAAAQCADALDAKGLSRLIRGK